MLLKQYFLFNSTCQRQNHTYIQFFELPNKDLFVNSTCQQENHTTHSPKIWKLKTEYAISTSQQGKKHTYIQFFELLNKDLFVNSTYQQENHTSHCPKIQIFLTEYAISTIQQRKNTPINNFWVAEKIFCLQFNMSTAKLHHPFSQDSEIPDRICHINKSTR